MLGLLKSPFIGCAASRRLNGIMGTNDMLLEGVMFTDDSGNEIQASLTKSVRARMFGVWNLMNATNCNFFCPDPL